MNNKLKTAETVEILKHRVAKIPSRVITELIHFNISNFVSHRFLTGGVLLLTLCQAPFIAILCLEFEDATSIKSQTFLIDRGGQNVSDLSHASTMCNFQVLARLFIIFTTD